MQLLYLCISYSRQEIKDYRYEIYKAYIQYLYTNKVDVTPHDAVGTYCTLI